MKHRFSLLSGIFFCLIVCTAESSAQDGSARVVNRGVLNGAAIQLPKPVYPEASRLAGSGGVVMVNVVIDELGNVISAEAMRNKYVANDKAAAGEPLAPTPIDPALIEAAEGAASIAKFAPTLLGGQPVRVKGMITYHFADRDARHPDPAAGTGTAHLLNQKAVSLPQPDYPAAAKAVAAQGLVAVQVSIDEAGNVVSANALSGHPLLRAAAVGAAKDAKFAPSLVNGEAVRVSGVLTYNFVLPRKEDQ